MSKSNIVKIALYSVLAVVLFGVLMAGLKTNWLSNGMFWRFSDELSSDYTTLNNKKSIDASSISKLDIEWVNGTITVEETSGNKIEFVEESSASLIDEYKMVYRVENGTLKIKYQAPQKFSFSTKSAKSKHLTLKIPSELDEIDIENVSSDISIYGITAANVDIDSVSGDIKMSDITIKSLDLENISGKTHIGGSIKSVDSETVSGKLYIESNTEITKIDAESVSGDIEITIPANTSGFTAAIETLSGNLTSDFEVKHANDRMVYKDGLNNYDFETLSGDVQLIKK